MKTPRWLLPFTWGVDMRAIDYAVRLAGSTGVTLVPVSLVSTPSKGARLEHIQQSKDFLEAVQHKAERYAVAVERYEVFTPHVLRSIRMLAYEMRCDGIVLLTRGEQTRLMQEEEVKQLLTRPPAALVLVRLPAYSKSPLDSRWLLSWWHGHRRQKGRVSQIQDAPIIEEPLWIRTEQHHLR